MTETNKAELKAGEFIHTRNCCGDRTTWLVKDVDENGEHAIITNGFRWEPKPGEERALGRCWGIEEVIVTINDDDDDDIKEIQWDANRKCWRSEITHSKGKRIQKNTPELNLEYSRFVKGFFIYRNAEF